MGTTFVGRISRLLEMSMLPEVSACAARHMLRTKDCRFGRYTRPVGIGLTKLEAEGLVRRSEQGCATAEKLLENV
jgi:hypothetical protein